MTKNKQEDGGHRRQSLHACPFCFCCCGDALGFHPTEELNSAKADVTQSRKRNVVEKVGWVLKNPQFCFDRIWF